MSQRESRKRTNIRSVTIEEYRRVRGIQFGKEIRRILPTPVDSTISRAPGWESEGLVLIRRRIEHMFGNNEREREEEDLRERERREEERQQEILEEQRIEKERQEREERERREREERECMERLEFEREQEKEHMMKLEQERQLKMEYEKEMENQRKDELFEQMRKQLEKVMGELSIEREKNRELEERNLKMEEKNMGLGERNKTLEYELERMQEKLEHEKENREILEEKLREGSQGDLLLMEHYKEKEEELEKIIQLNTQMADDFDKTQEELENTQKMLMKEKEEKERIKEEWEQQNQDIENIKQKLNKYIEELREKEQELETIREENDLTQRNLEEKRSELMMVKRDLENMTQDIQEMQEAKEKLATLEQELFEMNQMKSRLEEDLMSERHGIEEYQKNGIEQRRLYEEEIAELKGQIMEGEKMVQEREKEELVKLRRENGNLKEKIKWKQGELDEMKLLLEEVRNEMNSYKSLQSDRNNLMDQMKLREQEIKEHNDHLKENLKKEKELREEITKNRTKTELEFQQIKSTKEHMMDKIRNLLIQKFFLGVEIQRLYKENENHSAREKSLKIQLENARHQNQNLVEKLSLLNEKNKLKKQTGNNVKNSTKDPEVLEKINELNECMLKLEDRIISKLKNISPIMSKTNSMEKKNSLRDCSPFGFSKMSKKCSISKNKECFCQEQVNINGYECDFRDCLSRDMRRNSHDNPIICNNTCQKMLLTMGNSNCPNCTVCNNHYTTCSKHKNRKSLKYIENQANQQEWREKTNPRSKSQSRPQPNSKRKIKIFNESKNQIPCESTHQMHPDDYDNSGLFIHSTSNRSKTSNVQKPGEFLNIQLNPSGFSESNVVQTFRPSKDTLHFMQNQKTNPQNIFHPYNDKIKKEGVYATACWPKSPDKSENTEKMDMTMNPKTNDSFHNMEAFRQKLRQIHGGPIGTLPNRESIDRKMMVTQSNPIFNNMISYSNSNKNVNMKERNNSVHLDNMFQNNSQQYPGTHGIPFNPNNASDFISYQKRMKSPGNKMSPLMVKVVKGGNTERNSGFNGSLHLKPLSRNNPILINLNNSSSNMMLKTSRTKSNLKNALIKESKMKFRSKAQSLSKIKNNLKIPPKLPYFKKKSDKIKTSSKLPKYIRINNKQSIQNYNERTRYSSNNNPPKEVQKKKSTNLYREISYSKTQPNFFVKSNQNRQSLNSYNYNWRRSNEHKTNESTLGTKLGRQFFNNSLQFNNNKTCIQLNEPVSFKSNTSKTQEMTEYQQKLHSKFIKNVKNVDSQRSLSMNDQEQEGVFAKVVRVSVNGQDVPLESIKSDKKLHSELKRNGYNSFEDNGKKGYRKRSASHSMRNSRKSSENSSNQRRTPKPYEIQNSDENLPPRRRSYNSQKKRKVLTNQSHRYVSPRRINSKKSLNQMESTAKKIHSSSSQVNNFSRDENTDQPEDQINFFEKNIHMRETFKCKEEFDENDEKLGFSFHPNNPEKESLALWKNVSMPITSPQKMQILSKTHNEYSNNNSVKSQSKKRGVNPFNNSRESQDNRINSSKTKLIKFQASPHQSIKFPSVEVNISSLTNNNINGVLKNVSNSKHLGKPIWKDSPLNSFNKIQSFPSNTQKSNLKYSNQSSKTSTKENHKLISS